MSIVDLRSDTVARPTPTMRRAMAEAEVSDDVLDGDPTCMRLQEMATECLGKEAAVFVPSGTMANLIALMVHAHPGEEVILERRCHINVAEAGGVGRLANLQVWPLDGDRFGHIEPSQVERAIRTPDVHHPRTGLLCLENTHNGAGGTVLPPAKLAALADVAHAHDVLCHVDGARLFNAAAALGTSAAELARPVDSVMFCISKGLGAPVGSILAGEAAFIEEAVRVKKMLGAGMRQVGVLAAAGIVALEEMVERLPEDHANARRLAEGLAELPGISVDLETVQTNILFASFDGGGLSGTEFVERMADRGVLCIAFDDGRVRLVTHPDVDREGIERALAAARAAARAV